MKNKIKIVFVFSLILTLLPHCKNKDCHEDGTCAAEFYRIKINNEVKSYLLAQPGSYWIYKNTATNELDTQICTYFRIDSIKAKGTRNDTKHINIEYDRMKRYIKSSYNQWVYDEETNRNTPDASSYNNGRTLFNRAVGGEGEIEPFFYPFIPGIGAGTGSSYTSFIGMDTTLTIQGKNYANVVRFEIDKDDIWERKLNCIRSNNIYYWAKDIGLIKKEMKTCNMSWELIEYNIIK